MLLNEIVFHTEPITASNTHRIGYRYMIKDIIKPHSRDHEFLDAGVQKRLK